jgi:ABC-type transport system involved in multi-copper enzyme maturation permease subunit
MTKTAPAELSALQQKIRDDFPEWLSPIIVRELRQGLRTHAFVGGLILLHAVMGTLFCLKLTNAAAEVDDVVLRTRTIQEWTNYGLLAVFMALQPLRALVSISDEQKASTLDLVQLTSLSSWKIVWGKWSALAGQTLLLAVSLLPYELLSYFMGGYDVVASSIQWLMLLGFSLGFTAFALALSSSGWFVRISMLGLPAFFAWVFMLEMVHSEFFPLVCAQLSWAAGYALLSGSGGQAHLCGGGKLCPVAAEHRSAAAASK